MAGAVEPRLYSSLNERVILWHCPFKKHYLSLEHGWSSRAAPILQSEGKGADHAVLQVRHGEEGVHQVSLNQTTIARFIFFLATTTFNYYSKY
jgi:hypothetical protein